jgi:hypothetical protein
MACITPSSLDENPGKSTATHTGSENWLNDEHIFLIQEVLQWPGTSGRKFKRNTEMLSFGIRSRTWKALHQEEENKKKRTTTC